MRRINDASICYTTKILTLQALDVATQAETSVASIPPAPKIKSLKWWRICLNLIACAWVCLYLAIPRTTVYLSRVHVIVFHPHWNAFTALIHSSLGRLCIYISINFIVRFRFPWRKNHFIGYSHWLVVTTSSTTSHVNAICMKMIFYRLIEMYGRRWNVVYRLNKKKKKNCGDSRWGRGNSECHRE